MWHKGLLFKLKQNGINGKLLLWISNYLSNRKQKVIVKSSSSSLQVVTAGVPQGSVLGPLLFLIYVNDIAESVLSLTRLFSDVANDPSYECDEEIEDAVHYFFECQRYDIQRTVLFNATRSFHPLSINILLFGNPDLSDQDNQIIFDAVHSFIKSLRRF